MSASTPRPGWAIINDEVVSVEVLRNRKSDRTVLVRIDGAERGIPKSVVFNTKDAAMDQLARMQWTKEYAEHKAEELRRLEHHPMPPEPLEELDL